MATVLETFGTVNYFSSQTFTSSATLFTNDSYQIKLNASFPNSWGTPSTTNGSVSLTSGGGSAASTATYTITGMSAGSGSFTVPLSQSGGSGGPSTQTVNFSVSAALNGDLSPNSFATTESQGGVTVTANVNTTGTYYWDLERNPGEPSGSNSFGFGSPTSGTLSLTANTNQNFSTGAPNQNAGSTSNIGYQGVGFTIDLFTGPSRSGTLLDTSNWTIYETVTGLSIGSSSISLNAGDSTFSQNVTTNWRGSDSVSIRIRNTTLSTTVDSFSTSNGSTTLGRTGITSPPAGSSYNYRVEAFSGLSWLTNGPTFSVTRASYSPPDTDVTVTSSREYSPGVTSYTMSFSNGTNGDQYQLRTFDSGTSNGSVVGTATANASGTFSITVGSTYLANSGSSDTKWFSLYARRPEANGGDNLYDYCSGTTLVNSLNLTRRPYTPTINNVTDDDAASASVGIIINVSDSTSNSPGTVDRLYLYQYKNGAVKQTVNRTWGGNGNYADNFEQPRNTGGDNYYYRAFVQKSGDGAPYTPQDQNSGTSFSDYFPSNGGNYQAGYISPDTSVTTSRIPAGNLQADNSGTVTVFVSNGGTNDTYRIYRTSPSLLLIGDTGPLITTTGVVDLSEATSGHLPPPGQTYEYAISAKRAASLGGTDVYVNTGTTFSITKNGPSGTVAFAGATSATEGSGLEFVFTNNVDGTYYYDIDRLSGSVGGGEITNPGPSSFSVSSGSARLTLNFINDSTTEIGFQGEDFTMKYGTTSGASDLDTLNFTLYDDDSGISYTSSTVNVNGAATSHQISVVRATGDSSTSVSAYVAVSPGTTPLSTNLGTSFPLSTGTTVITVNDVPGAGSSETYYVRVYNGNEFINGPTYTVNQSAVPTAPASITFEADQNVADESILQAVTIAGGSGGTIQYSENNSTWFNYSGPTDFLFVRNTAKTIYARRNDGGALSSVSQSSKTYGYFTGDPSATASAKEASISANDLTGVEIAVEGGSAGTRYRVVNTSVSPTFGIGNTGDGNGTITATGNTQDLPGKGQTDTYKVQYKVLTAKGGDDTWRDVSPISNTTITRTTDIPNSFSFDTRTNQATNTEVVDNVQITGLTQESIVRRTAGTGTFAVSSTSTTPSAGSFSTADKTITNGQYIHVKDTTSTSAGTQKSTTISVGTQTLDSAVGSPAPETSTFSYTTAAAGDITANIAFDPETDTFNVILSPTVSGQDGSSQNNAREITGGTDVVFQNTSDPIAFEDIQVSGLGLFSNSASFSLAQGSSVTRTWDTGNLGNTTLGIILIYDTQVGDSTTLYFKEPPVDPDLTVTPVTPANIDWDKTTSFNVTVNDVTSGETYKITENNLTTSLGSATASGTSVTIPMTLGNSTTGYGQLGLGDTQTYEIHASRPANLGGTGSFVQTDDTFTVTRSSQVVVTPTDITFSPASTVSKSTNVLVDVVGDETEGRTLQIRLGNGSWLDAPQTYNLTRGEIYSFSARTVGFQGASVSGLRVESYQVPYLSPDTSVSVIVSTTIAANAGNQTVRVQEGSLFDTYTVTSLDGNTIYDSVSGNGNMTLTAASPDELPASGSNQSYRIRAQRPINSGGNNSPVNTTGSNNTFTISRSDPTQPTVTIDADPGTRSKSVSLGVDASGGTGSTFQVSEDNSTFVASGTAFQFTRGVNKTVYGRSLTDSNPSTSGTASRELDYIAPNTAITLALSTSSITAGATASITANFSGGTSGDIVDLRTNDTNTPLASGQSVGTGTFNSSGNASITISSGEQPDVTGTSAQYRAYVQTPQNLGGDGNYDPTSQTASITRGTITQPNDPSIPDDTTTRSLSVSLTVTVDGGSGGDLQLSEDNSTWFTGASRAFEFTRNVEKTIYARRIDGAATSPVSSSSRKLLYIPADTDVDLALSTTSISPGSTAQVTASIRNVTIGERLRILTTNANTQNGGVGFNVGSASARTSTTVAIALTDALNELPSFSTQQVVASYKLQVIKFQYDGGSGGWVDTGDTFSITRRAFTAPDSIQFPSDPGTLAASVSLTVNIAGGAEGSLQISEDNTNWTTATSGSFEFQRNVTKTIYARRIDGTQVSSVTSSSLKLSFLPPNSGVGISPSTTNISAGSTSPVSVAISGATPQDVYRLITTDTDTPQASGYVIDEFTGTTASSFTIPNNALPDVQNTDAGYRVEVRRPFSAGGDNAQDTCGTFTISRGGISPPDSIQFPSDPGTLSKSVSLTVTIGGGSGGDLQISENNSTWFTQTSRAFEFTRNVEKTIYARRNDAGTLSSVTQSSFKLTYLEPDTTIGITPSTTSITAGYGGTVTVAITGATAEDIYRIVTTDTNTPQVSGYVVDQFTGTTASSFTIANNELPDGLNTSAGYRVEALRPQNAGGEFVPFSASTFNISRGGLSAPDSIQFPSDPGTASKSVSLTVTIGGGSGGDLEISEDNSTWFTQASKAFEFTRNVEKTIYARRNDAGTLSSVTQSSFELAFLPGDGNITPDVSESSIAYSSTTPVTVDITDGASNTQYRVVNNSSPSTVYGNTITGNGTITLANPGDLPTAGGSIQYRLQFARTTASGGSGSFATATPATFTISRSAQDITPDAFNFTDTTNASRSSFQFSTVQITGLNDTAVVSVTQNNGAGEFVVDNNATAPSSGYGTSGSITNNQYLHARILSSDSLGGTVSSRFTVGTVSDDFKTTTTNQSADLVVNIRYVPADPEAQTDAQFSIFSSPIGFTTDAGNTVRFTFFSFDQGITSVSLSALNIFTNNADFVVNNGSNVVRTIASGTTPATTDTITVTSRGDDIITDTFNVTVTPLEPDTSVSIANVTMAASASTFTATIQEKSPNENSSVTQYLIKEGTTTLATKTGPGSVSASAFPPFLGVPVTRGLYARIPPASGGTNQQKFIQSFEVTRGSAPGGTDPLENTYGIAIYDNTGTLVTTFAEGSSIGKKIFTGTAATSTSACTEIATGLTGLSNANCFTIITSDASDGNPEGFKALPSTIKADGSTLLLGREQYASESVEVTIIQTKGATISNTTSPDYGVEIYNENGDLIIDDLAQCFAVREIINCAGATTFGGDYTLFDITLVEGRYPFSAGPPIPAIQGPGLRRLAPPYLLGGNANYSSSYGKVRVVLPQGISDVSNYNIAMLVDREANPVYYGGSASDYGIQVKDANGNVTWDSGWRQAVINNIVSANQFTLGTNQNGTYDVTTGYDGVIAPADGVGQEAELSLLTSSTGQTITINNLNIMDPTNTFLLGGGLVTGKVKYRQTYVNGEQGQVEPAGFYGGGTHVPAVTITSNSSVNITMLRVGDGPLPPDQTPAGTSDWGTRDPNSQHPAGYYVFARIT